MVQAKKARDAKRPSTKTNWQAAPAIRYGAICCAAGKAMTIAAQMEIRLRDRRDIRKAPVFVARGRETRRAETLEPFLAERLQPRGRLLAAGLDELAESVRVILQGLTCCRHYVLTR